MHSPNHSHVVLGFDFGMKRIGVAIGDTCSRSSKPLLTLPAADGIPDWDTITSLIEEWGIDCLVVGMPFSLDGSMQDITHAATKFMNRLRNKYALPVFQMDERLTTKIARLEINKKQATIYGIDSVAASIILQAWLDEANNSK